MSLSKDELIEHLAALLGAHVLDPSAAVTAAYEAGYKEADRTFETRRQTLQMNIQLQNANASGAFAGGRK